MRIRLGHIARRLAVGSGLLLLSTALAALSAAPAALPAAPAPAPAAPTVSGVVPPPPVLLRTPQFRIYGRGEGMPDAGSYMAVQDRQGNIWIGTRDGLVRYDGVHFKVFRHDARDPHSLPGDDISALLVDRQGRLWAGGEGTGLLLYRPGWGFQRWVHQAHDPHSLGSNDVMALAQTRDGAIWVGTYDGGLARLGPHGQITRLQHRAGAAASLASNVVFCLHATPDGSLWIGTMAGLDVLRPDGRLQHVAFPPGLNAPVMSIAGTAGSLRAVTVRGLFLLRDVDGTPRAEPVPGAGGVCFSTVTDASGGLWLACRNGLRYRDAAGRWSLFAPQPQLRHGLPAGVIIGLLRDREGGLWLTSNAGGLAYLPPDWRRFSLFRHLPDTAASLPYAGYTALVWDAARQSLLLGSSHGWLGRLDPATGAVQAIAPPSALPLRVNAMALDARGRLWVAMGELLFVRHRDGRWQQLVLPWPTNADSSVQSLLVAGPTLYVGSLTQGVARINTATLAVQQVPAPALHGPLQIEAMALHRGRLWVATQRELLHMDAAGVLRPLAGIAPGRISALVFGERSVWLARPSHLQQYRLPADDGAARLLLQVGSSQHWPGARVEALAMDAAGRVWASTLRGLVRYDPRNGSVDRFDEEAALSGLRGSAHVFAQGARGTLFTGVADGVLGFSPLQRGPALPQPQPRLLRIEVSGAGHDRLLTPRDGRVALGWRARDLSVTVRAWSYLNPGEVRYRMRLTPWSPNWIGIGREGVQNFGRLQPGTYRLEVQAQVLPGGPWGAAPPLQVHVAAPPWDTLWARLGYVLLALLLLLGGLLLWRRRTAQRQRVLLAEERRRVAEQASAAKTRFLAELGHEIRTPMTGVLGMCELLGQTPLDARQQSYVQAIGRSGALLQKLVNDALDLARIEAGRMLLDDAPYDPVLLAFDLAAAQRPLAAARGLQFGLDLQAVELPHRVLGDALRVRQVLLNLLGNALKFTVHGAVRLALWQQGERLCWSVSDTGPGIAPELRARLFQHYEQGAGPQRSAGSGLGLAISRELAQLMGGTLDVESQSGQGSRFTLCLPLRRAPVVADIPDVPAVALTSTPLSLLLVEDDATVAAVLAGLLGHCGHQVRIAEDGLAALALLTDWTPDVLLLDLDLPGVDGFALARMLRAREAPGMHLPILAVSARSGGDEAQRAAEAGMDGFLRKPVSAQDLADALAAVIARAQTHIAAATDAVRTGVTADDHP